jgi:hypothetical protein
VESIDFIGALVVQRYNQYIAASSICDGYIFYDGVVVKGGEVINSDGSILRVEKTNGGCKECFFLYAQCPRSTPNNYGSCIFKPGFVAKEITHA